MAADQVAGDHRQVGMQLARGIDDAGEFALAEEGAEVDVAEVQDAQAVEIGRQAIEGDVHFAHAEIGALDEGAVAHGGEGRGHQRAAGGIQEAAAARDRRSRERTSGRSGARW